VLLYCWVTHLDQFRPIDTNLAKLFSVQLLIEKIEFDFLNIAIDRVFLAKSFACLGLAILLFVTQTITKITPGVAALSVAMILFVITRINVEEILLEIEWSTLLFFSGLFVLVGFLEKEGVIDWIAHNVFLRAGHNPYVMVLVVLWVSGIVSGFIDNIPFTITMIPIVRLMMETQPIPNNILWWALSLGACFGGNLTLIGASANIVSSGMARKYGYEISIRQLIRDLAAAGIEHLVIPEYNLSHFMNTAKKLLLGATSVTADRKVIATIGSANIAGLCHLNDIPVYLLVNSLKFAHQSVTGQKIHKTAQMQSKENLKYTQITFSHDIVDFDLIDHVITEEGEISVISKFGTHQ
jgi:hypothetical protein